MAAPLLSAQHARMPSHSGVLDMECVAGSVTVLTGPSAPATSCWLETLAALRPLGAGTLRLHGRHGREYDSRDARRHTGYVDLAAPLVSSISVRMNVMLPRLHHLGESLATASRHADHLLDRFEYADAREVLPARIGSLDHLKALFARALSLDPALLFVDEPFPIALVAHWNAIAQLMLSLAHNEQRALVVATRNLAFATDADQIAFVGHNAIDVYHDWNELNAQDDAAAFVAALPFAVERRAQ